VDNKPGVLTKLLVECISVLRMSYWVIEGSRWSHNLYQPPHLWGSCDGLWTAFTLLHLERHPSCMESVLFAC